MEHKRLKAKKNTSTEKAAEISFCAKEQLFGYVNNQFIETIKISGEFEDVSSKINKWGCMILRTGYNVNEYYAAIAGKSTFKKRKIEICETVSNLCKSAEPYIAENGISFLCKVPEERIFVFADQEKIVHAFLEILLNSAENTPEKGKIRVVISKTKKYVKITVSDNGFGMDSETAEHCTEPFFTKSEDYGAKKLGIGLTAAHYFVAGGGGRLEFRSEKEKGTSVSILFPVMTEEEEKLSVGTEIPDLYGEVISPVKMILSALKK